MPSLPPEIIYLVCSFLGIDDVQRFRLASKWFADIGAAYMLPEVSFTLHAQDLDRLRVISLHPLFSKHVRKLTCHADVIDSPKVSWVEYLRNHQARIRTNPMLRGQQVDGSQLGAEYKIYSDAVDAQDKLIEGKGDLTLLKDVLPRFPSLKTLRMVADNVDYATSPIKRSSPLAEYLEKGYINISPPEGKRALEVLLSAIAHSPYPPESLQAATLYWRFFQRSERELARMFRPLVNLIAINFSLNIDPADEWIDDGFSLRKCQKVLGKGAIRNILRRMPRLRRLHFEILNSLIIRCRRKGCRAT